MKIYICLFLNLILLNASVYTTPENVFAENSRAVIKSTVTPPSNQNVQITPKQKVIRPEQFLSIELKEDSIIDNTSYFQKGTTKLELLSGTIILARLEQPIDSRMSNVPFSATIKNNVYTNQNQLFFQTGDKILGNINTVEDNNFYRLELIPRKAIIERLNKEISIEEATAIPADNERINELGQKDYSDKLSNAIITDIWNSSIENSNLELVGLAKGILGIGNQRTQPVIRINSGQLIMIKLGRKLSLWSLSLFY